MINGDLEQFLDTGMLHDCSLYYKGYLYYLDAYIDPKMPKEKRYTFIVDKMKSEIINEIYQKRVVGEDGKVISEVLLYLHVKDEYESKKIFFESKLFEGKTFWEVEKEIAWYDE